MSTHSVLLEAPPATAPALQEDARFLNDPAGLTWRVAERQPPAHLADRCARCLIFDAGTIVRRVCGADADWRRLTDAQLLALCHAPA